MVRELLAKTKNQVQNSILANIVALVFINNGFLWHEILLKISSKSIKINSKHRKNRPEVDFYGVSN